MKNLYDGNGNVISIESNPWDGKKWMSFGTSITDVGVGTGKYVPYLAEYSGMSYDEYGGGGSWLTEQGGIYGAIMSKTYNGYDLITIEGFINDWYKAKALGVFGDKTTDTFYGSLYVVLKHLQENSNARIVVITDHPTRATEKYPKWGEFAKNSNGATQMDFWKATKEVCNAFGVPVIEAGANSGMSTFTEKYYVDQIHHSDIGGEVFAEYIWNQLKNIPPLK